MMDKLRSTLVACAIAASATTARAGTCPTIDDSLRAKLGKAWSTPVDKVGGPQCAATRTGYWLFVDLWDTAMGNHRIAVFDAAGKEVAGSTEQDNESNMRATSLHGLVAADLDGDGVDEVVGVVTQAFKNQAGTSTVMLYCQKGKTVTAAKVQDIPNELCEVTFQTKDKKLVVKSAAPASDPKTACGPASTTYVLSDKGLTKN